MILSRLQACYLHQMYRPSFWAFLINPFYITRRGLMFKLASVGKQIRGRTLDVGCGTRPYADLFNATEYVGLELDTPSSRARATADVYYDGGRFPFDDGTFSSVVSNQVLEHVPHTGQFLDEVYRMLRVDGMLLLTAPFIWDEHEQPNDYLRYSSFGIKALLEQHNFEVISQHKSVNDIRAVFQMLILYIHKKTCTSNAYVNLLSTVMFMAPFTALAGGLALLLPRNDDLYLDNVVLARKLAPKAGDQPATRIENPT